MKGPLIFATIGVMAILLLAALLASPAMMGERPGEKSHGAVERLEQLGYFKYTPSKDVVGLKESLAATLEQHQSLMTQPSCDTDPLARRFYACGAMPWTAATVLQSMRPTFDALKLDMMWGEVTCVKNGAHVEYAIDVNGKKAVLYQGKRKHLRAWVETAMSLAEIINGELALQGKEERLYPVQMGLNSGFIYLTSEQFEFIRSLELRDESRPLTLDEWRGLMKDE